jgi:outer membrane protein assembly factor BamB
MNRIFQILTIATLAANGALAAEKNTEPQRQPWSQYGGPFGDFNPLQYGQKLVDSIADAKVLWISETTDLGWAKGAILASSFGPDAKYHCGSWAGPIVADGKVFAASRRPAKQGYKIPVEGNPSAAHGKVRDGFVKTEDGKHYLVNVEAEDIVVAMDFNTGKTIWVAAEPGGLLKAGGKREGDNVTPCYYQGKVFSVSSVGVLYAYDAKTGKKLWQSDIGPATAVLKANAAKATATLKEGKWAGAFQNPIEGRWHISLVAAEGVLIVPTFDQGGLRGVEPATGKELWKTPSVIGPYATPTVWTHKGRQYLLVSAGGAAKGWGSGSFCLMDPRTGKILWAVGKIGPASDVSNPVAPIHNPLTASEEHVFVNHKSKHFEVPGREGKDGKEDGNRWNILAAYRITPEKAELAWTMPDELKYCCENHLDTIAMRRTVVRDGKVYHWTTKTNEGHVIDEKTGKVLASAPFSGAPRVYVVEDRILATGDAAHSQSGRSGCDVSFFSLKDLQPLSANGHVPVGTTGGYDVHMEFPYADGRWFVRTPEGQVACIDLRAPVK